MVRRFFYRQFRLASRIQWSLGRRLTPAGRLVAGALMASVVFGPNTRLTVGYQAFALLAVSVACALVPPRPLAVRRRLPKYATAGESVAYDIVLTNRGARRRAAVSLIEDLADPRPSFEAFASTPEPDESR